MTKSDLLAQPSNKSDNVNKLVTSYRQVVANLEQAVRAQLGYGLLADW